MFGWAMSANSQPSNGDEEVVDVSQTITDSTQKSIEKVRARRSFFEGKTGIKDPFKLRDPFQAPQKPRVKKTKRAGGNIINGVFTNVTTVGAVDLEKIKIVGILVGKERRALAQVGGETVVLKEGMNIGDNGASLKAILPGGIVLVEKITNVYGEEEYLETVVPISDE